MKILYFQDSHIRGNNPSMRKDDYFASMCKKVDEIGSLVKKEKCEMIICGGDLWDTPLISNSILDTVVDKFEEMNIPIAILPGNHDMTAHNWDISQASSLAHIFRRSENITMLTNRDVVAIRYSHNIEQEIINNGIMFEESVLWKVAIVHALITPKPFFPEVMHIEVSKIKTNADLVLVAHYHEPYDIMVGKTRFLNIGCLGRTSIKEADIKPSVAILDTETHSVKVLELKKALPAEKAFDLEKKAQIGLMAKDMTDFVDALKSTKFQSLDLRGKLEAIAKEKNVSQEIVDMILQKIGECDNE